MARGTLTDGVINPHDLLRISGMETAIEHMSDEIRQVYMAHRLTVRDVHIEIILAQMTRRRKVIRAGSTPLFPGMLPDQFEKWGTEGGEPPSFEPVILGISEAALPSEEHFLARASMISTRRVLAEAAWAGRTSPLTSITENVLMGRLIPVGTGMRRGSERRGEGE